MKIVINMPQKVVTAIQNGEDYRYDIHTAIAQGTPYEERSNGEWLVVGHDDTTYWYRCSICEYEEHDNFTKHHHFCPNCGACMIKGTENEDSN